MYPNEAFQVWIKSQLPTLGCSFISSLYYIVSQSSTMV